MLAIGRIQLPVPFLQAGLEGYSDMPMRVLARRRGCAFALTEAMSDEMIAMGGNHVKRRLAVRDDDHPIAGQILGADPEMMARAAAVLAGLGYDVIDVNLGCPVRKQTRLRGGHLLRDPATAIAILKAVRDAVPAGVPVTVKMRRASDESPEAADRFQQVFAGVWEAGLDAACVHGRTVDQFYQGQANWEFLTALKRAYPTKVILGSGDLFTAPDAVRMLDVTGVDGVWLARGAIANPWIFREAEALWRDRRVLPPPTIAQQRAVLVEHLQLIQECYDPDRVPGRMKTVLLRYARFHPQQALVRQAALDLKRVEHVEALIARYYSGLAETLVVTAPPSVAPRL